MTHHECNTTNSEATCSFCGESRQIVGTLAQGMNNAYICCGCASLCLEKLKKDHWKNFTGKAKELTDDELWEYHKFMLEWSFEIAESGMTTGNELAIEVTRKLVELHRILDKRFPTEGDDPFVALVRR